MKLRAILSGVGHPESERIETFPWGKRLLCMKINTEKFFDLHKKSRGNA
jgi:hypothetical protein